MSVSVLNEIDSYSESSYPITVRNKGLLQILETKSVVFVFSRHLSQLTPDYWEDYTLYG